MSFIRRFLRILLLSCLVFQVQGANPQLEEFLDGLDTFQASFEQNLTNAKGEVIERSLGTLYIQNPGKFHWAYSDPYAQSIITDGVTLWIYDEDIEQVTIKNVEGEIDSTPAVILSGSKDIDQFFQIRDKGTIGEMHIVELSPLDPENQFHSIELGLEGKFLKQMVMFDKLGQKTEVNFSDSKRNESLEESLFNFVPPEDADVVDGRL